MNFFGDFKMNRVGVTKWAVSKITHRGCIQPSWQVDLNKLADIIGTKAKAKSVDSGAPGKEWAGPLGCAYGIWIISNYTYIYIL